MSSQNELSAETLKSNGAQTEKPSFDSDREYSKENLIRVANEYVDLFESKFRSEYGQSESVHIGKFVQKDENSAMYLHQEISVSYSEDAPSHEFAPLVFYKIRTTATDLDDVSVYRDGYEDDNSIQGSTPNFPLEPNFSGYDSQNFDGDIPFSFTVDRDGSVIFPSYDPRMPLPEVLDSYSLDYHSSPDFIYMGLGKEQSMAKKYVENLAQSKIKELNLEDAGADIDDIKSLVEWGDRSGHLAVSEENPIRRIESSVRPVTIKAEKIFESDLVLYSIEETTPKDSSVHSHDFVFSHNLKTGQNEHIRGDITPLIQKQLSSIAVEHLKASLPEKIVENKTINPPVLQQSGFVPFELKEPFVFEGLPESLHKEATEVVNWIDSRGRDDSSPSPNGFTGFEGVDYDTDKCYTLQSPKGENVFQASVISSNTADRTVFRVDKFDVLVINKELEAIKILEDNPIVSSPATRELRQLFSNLSPRATLAAEGLGDRDTDTRSMSMQDPLEEKVNLLKPRDLSGKDTLVEPKITPKPKPKGIER